MEQERLVNGGAYRQSHHIKRHPAVNVHHATRYCERIGLPLNRFVTINFTVLGCEPRDASRTSRRMLAERFAPWLRRSSSNQDSVAPTYVWAIEAAGRQTACHWLVHIPGRLQRAFIVKLDEWLTGMLRERPAQGATNVKPIYNLIGARWYVLKGTEPVWAEHLGVRHVPQGLVFGKRSGFSRNLGPAARKRGGYMPLRVPLRVPPKRKSANDP